ncbi:hypothetical protein F5J12DRAFT_802520 [Pisolithus orientalis]|uniref:uncharacterized protein n=1 Tax=Pisolithus orientalis TaxID=936130 RepID=UPI0022254D9D|nr:uncharacterized protein F5J12DRAFT_802520 [Pisolithus orientalis]KAI6030732.1 hypothetical protein F5J12DRAFT_802520 [Pisolithus orientalis]
MPLDGYTYLTSYGWTGKGNGLRKGAIEKPIAIPQKRSLAGVGKDRDEAFPFWDHLFTAASKAITIKVASDDDDDENENENDEDLSKIEPPEIKRTSTGIISNRRPVFGTATSESTSGTATPDPYVGPKLSLIAAAKREAVKRGLYSRFFRGPVLGPDHDPSTCTTTLATSTSPSLSASSETTPEPVEKKSKRRRLEGNAETKEERRERKRIKRERKEARRLKRAAKAKSSGDHDVKVAGIEEGEDASSLDRGSRMKPSTKKKHKRVKEDSPEVEPDSENEMATRKRLAEDNRAAMQDDLPRHVSSLGCENPGVELNLKKKKGKRKHSS